MNRRSFFGAASATVAATCGAAATTSSRKSVRTSWIPNAALLDSLPGLMRLACVPGLSIAAVERGTLAWQRSFGVADVETGVALSDDTLFEAASISKPVFAYAVLALVEQGQLNLDLPLVRYYRPTYLPQDPRLERLTARHVLTHSSGLRNWGDDAKPDSLRPMFEPGERVSYSGEGFFLLQLVVEHITGKGLDAFMRAQLFERAGMKNSMFTLDEAAARNTAYGHQGGRHAAQQGLRDVLGLVTPLAKQWGKPLREWSHDDWLRAAAVLDPKRPAVRVRFQNAASSLFTTAADYGRFIALMMDGASRRPWQISDKLRREMISPLIAVQDGLPLWRGLGWSLERCEGELRFGHEGNNDGRFTTYAAGDAARGHGLVVLTNADAGFGVYQRIVREATGCDQLSFIANLSPPV